MMTASDALMLQALSTRLDQVQAHCGECVSTAPLNAHQYQRFHNTEVQYITYRHCSDTSRAKQGMTECEKQKNIMIFKDETKTNSVCTGLERENEREEERES